MGTMIEVNNVSMAFRMDINRPSGLKDWVVNFATGKRDIREFRALSGVSFTVEKGEVIGIIGRNGSGFHIGLAEAEVDVEFWIRLRLGGQAEA